MISKLMMSLANSDVGSAIFEYISKEVERIDSEIKQLDNDIAALSLPIVIP